MSEIDDAELVRMRGDAECREPYSQMARDVLALLGALEKTRGERDQFAEQLAIRSEIRMHADMQEIMRINNVLRESLKPFATVGSGFDMDDVRKARAALAAPPAPAIDDGTSGGKDEG